jgi:hypothetical protein
VPSSPHDLYLSLRRRGADHDEAIRKTAHAYSRTPDEMVQRVEPARLRWENGNDRERSGR